MACQHIRQSTGKEVAAAAVVVVVVAAVVVVAVAVVVTFEGRIGAVRGDAASYCMHCNCYGRSVPKTHKGTKQKKVRPTQRPIRSSGSAKPRGGAGVGLAA